MNNVTLLGIDLAKNTFQLCGYDEKGNVKTTRRLSRNKLLGYVAQLPDNCEIAMESCGSANYWAREFSAMGYKTKLICPKYVKPYVQTNKNDYNDARAICEAASRPTMRFVTHKTVEQQDIQSIHRMRERLVESRTSLVNQARGLLSEYGVIIPKGIVKFRKEIIDIISDEHEKLSCTMRDNLLDFHSELEYIDDRILALEDRLRGLLKNNDAYHKLQEIPGIGPVTAAALLAQIGDEAEGFKSGRHLSAFLGLVPRQSSSGDKTNLLSISKRGDSRIRGLLIHGARAVIQQASKKTDKISKWVMSLKERSCYNKAAVALANKNARIVWALLSSGGRYDPEYATAV